MVGLQNLEDFFFFFCSCIWAALKRAGGTVSEMTTLGLTLENVSYGM